MQKEIKELQEQRGSIYGDFKTHCENVGKLLGVLPEQVGLFYLVSKQVRWESCPDKRNKDSVIDWLSYADLFKKAFPKFKGPTDAKIEEFKTIYEGLEKMKKICKGCNKEVSRLEKGGLCPKCRGLNLNFQDAKPLLIENGSLRTTLYHIPENWEESMSNEELLPAITHNFKVHCSTGFKNDTERRNYERCKKAYKIRFRKEFPKC